MYYIVNTYFYYLGIIIINLTNTFVNGFTFEEYPGTKQWPDSLPIQQRSVGSGEWRSDVLNFHGWAGSSVNPQNSFTHPSKNYISSRKLSHLPHASNYQRHNVDFTSRPAREVEYIESSRHFEPQTLTAISETLGALNSVGRYLVNMTRGDNTPQGNQFAEDIPAAVYTISKNVLGPRVADTIAPLVKEALPTLIKPVRVPAPTISSTESYYDLDDDAEDKEDSTSRVCTTPEGANGYCDDLSNCPQLLLNLGNLRQSLCFKSLFVPGVCCPVPHNDTIFSTTSSYPVQFIQSSTARPVIVTTTSTTTTTTTSRPYIPVPFLRPTQFQFNNSLLVDPQECGEPEPSKFRVVGGEESLPGRWPWMAAIFLHGSRRTEFWCGGSLITAHHVLTAAHCTRDASQRPFSPRQFTVRLGDIDLKRDDEPSAPITVPVKEIRAHPRFSRVGFYNDIALVILANPVRKSRYVMPLCLPQPSQRYEQFSGERSTVVGWGTTYYGGKESTIQRQAVLPVWRNEDCNAAYFQPITENFVCAGYAKGGVDACQGDSGGPLMVEKDHRWIQIGIVSFGNKCGEPGYPGVYTRVTSYIDWINANIN